MSAKTRTVTDESFETDVLASPVPVLVDFWAQWCTPCKMIAPLIDETADTYAGRLAVAKLDIDANPSVPSRFHVRSIPTLMIFKDGEPVATHVGALGRARLEQFIEETLRLGSGAPPAQRGEYGRSIAS